MILIPIIILIIIIINNSEINMTTKSKKNGKEDKSTNVGLISCSLPLNQSISTALFNRVIDG